MVRAAAAAVRYSTGGVLVIVVSVIEVFGICVFMICVFGVGDAEGAESGSAVMAADDAAALLSAAVFFFPLVSLDGVVSAVVGLESDGRDYPAGYVHVCE